MRASAWVLEFGGVRGLPSGAGGIWAGGPSKSFLPGWALHAPADGGYRQ